MRQATPVECSEALDALQRWVEKRSYAGFDPYDWLNSPVLKGLWSSKCLSSMAIQAGRRFAGTSARQLLAIRPSVNPKAVGLFMSGYCDLANCGDECSAQLICLKQYLTRLRAAEESEYAWGYDWNFTSMRGSVMPAFAPNSIATVFCAEALLDLHETFGDTDAFEMARSASRFCVTRLNRSFENPHEICFSYTPDNRTLIFNSSALVGALLARIGSQTTDPGFLDMAKRSMNFLAAMQRSDGSWTYGCSPRQQWIDGFHTGYNLSAIAAYRRRTGDKTFDTPMLLGYDFYKNNCFASDGRPKYFHDRLFPIDIHACSQAILTFCDFAELDPQALDLAARVAAWTVRNMRATDGSFFYQKHRLWTNRTPYMRWGQSWMFRALARLVRVLKKA